MDKTYNAYWTGDEYRTNPDDGHGFDWRSDDGDNWITGDGIPVECIEFEQGRMVLIDGPRDGATVS